MSKKTKKTEEKTECTDCLYYKIQNELLPRVEQDIEIPQSITDNLKLELRDYQIEALTNFIYYNEIDAIYKKIENKHLLFHMATGSGKTQIIASCILYLYEKGYRNFLFFTNANSIIEKTISNFIKDGNNPYSYLFTDTITINRKKVRVNKMTGSFDKADKNAINIVFTSIQQMRLDLLTSQENKDTRNSLKKHKVVFIADEAHHLNAGNKKSKTEEKNENNWTDTVVRSLNSNSENILLEFSATAGFKSNEQLMEHYRDKVIYDFDFEKFDKAGYSKRISLI